ncbi:MAG: hypothetical protein HFJ26_05275 [Clostridia bacterium]|jgi:hypothetical protein|nr:hypothetical protein [Clostridia bacterium]
MEENSNNKQTYQVIDMSDHEKKEKKSSSSFSKSILLPFCSGVLGATLVVGTCFGVPQIRTYLMGKTEFVQTSSPSRKYRNT